MQPDDQALAAKALPGWYWISGRGIYQRAEIKKDRAVTITVPSAFVIQDVWHGGWVATKDDPGSRAQRWMRPVYMMDGLRFDDPTAAMAAVEVELAANRL